MPATETKLTEAQLKVLKLIAADGRPVLPNDLAMWQEYREMDYLGLLMRNGYLIEEGDGGVRVASAYSVSRKGWKVLKGGK